MSESTVVNKVNTSARLSELVSDAASLQPKGRRGSAAAEQAQPGRRAPTPTPATPPTPPTPPTPADARRLQDHLFLFQTTVDSENEIGSPLDS